ncbi:MAG TPA: hypothetical protein ENN19_14390 [Chloroflexi bacterium]|nr:hypothetical protein [Chloroflexota bacterium]
MRMTNAGWRRMRWLGIASAMSVSLVLIVVAALASAARSIPPGPTNLSQSQFMSFFADVAVSPDGEQVVVVWPEAHTVGTLPPFGSVRLRWISESDGEWRAPATVFAGSPEACAEWASVDVSTGTAHLAYLVSRPCSNVQGGADTQTIYYQTYDLPTGEAGFSHTVTTTQVLIRGFEQVDIALDASGTAHFAYIYSDGAGATGELTGTIYYRDFGAGVFGPEMRLSETANARDPVIACADERVHVIWSVLEEREEERWRWQIAHRRRDGGAWGTVDSPIKFSDDYNPRHPAIAARGDDVLVSWSWESEEDQYMLAYSRYTQSWPSRIYEVGTTDSAPIPLNHGDAGLRTPTYTYRSGTEIWADYDFALRPSVALDRDGLPVVVWQAYQGDSKGLVHYSRALSKTQVVIGDQVDHVFIWSEPAVFNRYTQRNSLVPKLAMAPVVSPSLHVVYLREMSDNNWDTYYEGESEQQGDKPNAVFLPLVMRGCAAGGDD